MLFGLRTPGKVRVININSFLVKLLDHEGNEFVGHDDTENASLFDLLRNFPGCAEAVENNIEQWFQKDIECKGLMRIETVEAQSPHVDSVWKFGEYDSSVGITSTVFLVVQHFKVCRDINEFETTDTRTRGLRVSGLSPGELKTHRVEGLMHVKSVEALSPSQWRSEGFRRLGPTGNLSSLYFNY
ncbi:hypothetical protein TNCV_1644221 [Trichonephila clavipes]|nr:hypothetical protein TNCV_1644221 [Trichonephila clavipes]